MFIFNVQSKYCLAFNLATVFRYSFDYSRHAVAENKTASDFHVFIIYRLQFSRQLPLVS